MPIEIIWSPTALDHLQAIYEYILADNPAAALDVHEEIERAAGLLQENPRLGHPGRVADTRELVVPAYPTYIIVVRAAREPSAYPGRHAREATVARQFRSA